MALTDQQQQDIYTELMSQRDSRSPSVMWERAAWAMSRRSR